MTKITFEEWKNNYTDFPFLEENLKLIENFASQGFKKNQIFITGRSCGGWMTMMLLARHQNIVAGGISFVPECYGRLTKN